MFTKEDAIKRILEVTLSPGQDEPWRREVVRSCLEGYAEACMYVMRNRFDLATTAALEAALKDMQED